MAKWVLLPQDAEKSRALAGELKISPLLAQILINRGVADCSAAKMFLNPRLANLSDPFEIPNIKQAVARVIEAINKKENVLVFGDYDVDGVTGTAIILETLKYLAHNASHYIPFRYDEGYSLNVKAVEKAKADRINLIITVDCGVSSHKEIELANQLGIDVIITDHHNLPNTLPAAHSIVNPKMITGSHPSRELSGAGVAFKFSWALIRMMGIKDNAFVTGLLDLAALGTIADIVPLTSENRIIAYAGLNVINQKKRIGIKNLVESAGIDGEVTMHNINFALAPRINAAGRLEHASLALKLLTTGSEEEAKNIAKDLSGVNQRRQSIGSRIQEEAFKQIEEQCLQKEKIIVLAGEDWHSGVIGIIASRITEKYCRPAVLIGRQKGIGRGSARSIEGVDIYEVLYACKDLFKDFGGHAGAAGFEIEENKLEDFIVRIKQQADAVIDENALTSKLIIDATIETKELSLSQAKELEALGPFGEGNEPPVLLSRNLRLEEFRLVGPAKNHLKGKFSGLDAIGFNLGNFNLALFKNYDLVYNLESNLWNNFENVQLKLLDVAESK